MSINLGNIWDKKQKFKLKSTTYKNKQIVKKNKQIVNFKKYNKQKDVWGRPTWYLFHTIAAKIEPNYYKKNYIFIWNFIKSCCSNLPCPYCRNHAVKYVKKIKNNEINTKEKLEKVLFDFHNYANINAYKQQFNWANMDMYKKSQVIKIFNYFERGFFRRFIGTREFNGWIKNNFKKGYKEFYSKTISHYI